jgi:hypothetical protein
MFCGVGSPCAASAQNVVRRIANAMDRSEDVIVFSLKTSLEFPRKSF